MSRDRKINWEDFRSGYREYNGRPVLRLTRLFEELEQGKTTRHVERVIAYAARNPSSGYAHKLAKHPNCPPEVKAAVEDRFKSHSSSDTGLFGCLADDF